MLQVGGMKERNGPLNDKLQTQNTTVEKWNLKNNICWKQEIHSKTKNPRIHSQKNAPTSKPDFWQVSGLVDASTRLSSNDLKIQEEVSI